MSSVVVAVSVENTSPTKPIDPSIARKRRREILTSQRQTMQSVMSTPVLATPVTSDDEDYVLLPRKKCRRVSNFTDSLPPDTVIFPTAMDDDQLLLDGKTNSLKKPQMKYDPDVPMTKEEAAVWRREQRRKRNRESAAMSRQRQRDRIAVLEVEVADWKQKVDSVMERIQKLETSLGIDHQTLLVVAPPPLPNIAEIADLDLAGLAADLQAATAAAIHTAPLPSKLVSPPVSPGHSSLIVSSTEPSYVVSSSLEVDAVVDQILGGGFLETEHSDKMISRHAVKIADAPTLPILPKPIDSSVILPPVPCVSGSVPSANGRRPRTNQQLPASKLDPIDSSLFSVKNEEVLPNLLADESNSDEFGEFLMDAVQWL